MNLPILVYSIGGISNSGILFYIGLIVTVLFGGALIFEGVKELNFTFFKKLFKGRKTRIKENS